MRMPIQKMKKTKGEKNERKGKKKRAGVKMFITKIYNSFLLR